MSVTLTIKDTEKNKVRIGVVGIGVMGQRHCEAINDIPNAKIAAVCGIRKEVVEGIKEKHNALNGYTSWQELLRNESLDMLCIATPGPSHGEITIAAAKAGVPRIFCEKPMAVSIKDSERMIEACRTNSVRLAVNHSRRLVPSYVSLKSKLKEGIIGDIRHVTLEMAGGQLGSNGGHLWDLIRFLTEEEPVSIIGYLDKTGTPNPRGNQYVDPGAYGLLWLTSGIKVFFNMSEDFGVPFYMEIMGSVGRVLVDEKAGNWEVFARRPEDRDMPMTKRPPLIKIPFDGEKVDIVASTRRGIEELLSDNSISCSGEDALVSLAITVGAHNSEAENNRPISFPLSDVWRNKGFSFT